MAMNVSAGKRGAISPVMNVTPLVDVVLVLLIIFMVVTPMLHKQFWLNLPQKDEQDAKTPPPPSDADKPVVLTVDAAGVVRINQKEIPRAELGAQLTRIFAARADGVLYFDAADDAPYGLTVEVMDLARRGGGRSIAILTEKPAH
jgi:biopolymer transport protein ExbD/biopolymer transport protein TolR